MIIYVLCISLISGIYFSIFYYVLHLPLIERYRRKQQLALLRRIPILLLMILIPGFIYLILILDWIFFRSLPLYFYRISTLIESLAQNGAVITIFISNTRLRRYCYRRRMTDTIVNGSKSRHHCILFDRFKQNRTNKHCKSTNL